MFGRKRSSKGAGKRRGKSKKNSKAKKVVKRLLEKPGPDRMADVAKMAAVENLQPFVGSGLGQAGACDAVAVVMAMFPEHRFVQVEACRAVEALADGNEENVQLLGEADCCELVEKALDRFPNDPSIQTQGCRAVTNLFNGEANIRKLGQGRACELVTEALRKFPKDADVQIEACGAVANLANNSKSNRIKLGRAGACSLVTTCMSTFPDNIDVQHAACVAVGNLANRHAENKKRLGTAGACNKVCAALASFQGDLGVQYMGCGAVGNLSNSNAQNCTRLGEAGGCLLVTGGMNAFQDDRNLQHVGCAAVANLAINNPSNAERLVKAGAGRAVQRALDVFTEDEEIQTRGQQALVWLTSKNRAGTMISMKKLTGPESRRQQSRKARDTSFGGSSVGSTNRGGWQQEEEKRGGGFESLSEEDEEEEKGVLTETEHEDDEDDDDGYDSATSLEDDRVREESEGDSDENWEDDGASVASSMASSMLSSVVSSSLKPMEAVRETGSGAVGEGRHSRNPSVEVKKVATATAAPTIVVPEASTAPLGVGVVPTPPNNRPRSKAEQPIGELLEDFDSDGEGTYGPGPGPDPGRQQRKAGGGESEQVAGGGRVAVGPSPPRAQAPSPDMLSSGGDPAGPHNQQTKPSATRDSSRTSHARGGGSSSSTPGRDTSRGGSGATRAMGSGTTVPAGGDPAASNGGLKAVAPTRKAMEQLERAAAGVERAMVEGPGHRRGASRRSSKSGGTNSRMGSTTDVSLQSAGAVALPSDFPTSEYSNSNRESSNPKSHAKSERSFGSGRSSNRKQRQTAEELLGDPAMAAAPEVAELLRNDEAVAHTLQTITGKDPAWFPTMLANVERLVQRSREMEGVTTEVRRDVTLSNAPAVGDSLLRREYFDVLYQGLCGAHIVAAVVARGGIVADSKDGWLRKASALVRVVSVACPSVKIGVELLGRALQLAERDKMADHLEQVAKSSKTPGDVSQLVSKVVLRLLEEGRAETNERSLDAMKALEVPTDEWLPAWLLEEAAVEGDQKDGGVVVAPRSTALPGTEMARRAAMVDGCSIVKAIGRRSLRKMSSVDRKADVLIDAVLSSAAAGGPSARAAGGAEKSNHSRGRSRGGRDDRRRPPQQQQHQHQEDKEVREEQPPPAPPTAASTIIYPPISPSTLPPGQGPAASPTRSALGAVRRAEERGAREVAAYASESEGDGAVDGGGVRVVPGDAGYSTRPEAAAPTAPAAAVAVASAAAAGKRAVSPRRAPKIKAEGPYDSRAGPPDAPKSFGSAYGNGGRGAGSGARPATSATVPASPSSGEDPHVAGGRSVGKASASAAPGTAHVRKKSGKIKVPDIFKQSTKPPNQPPMHVRGGSGASSSSVSSSAAAKPRSQAAASAAVPAQLAAARGRQGQEAPVVVAWTPAQSGGGRGSRSRSPSSGKTASTQGPTTSGISTSAARNIVDLVSARGGNRPSQAGLDGGTAARGFGVDPDSGAAAAATAAGAAAKEFSAAAGAAGAGARAGVAGAERAEDAARAGARSVSVERRQGPRRIRVAGKSARRISPDKQREATGLQKDQKEAAQEGKRTRGPPRGPAGGRSPKKGLGGGGGGGSGAFTTRVTPRGKQGPSPRTSGAGEAIAAAQRSWGRSGSWYEPRRRGMSQTSVAASAFPSQTEEGGVASDAAGGDFGGGEDEDDEAAIGGGGRTRSVPTPPPSEVKAVQEQQQQQEEALPVTPDARPVADLASAELSSRRSRSRSRSRESQRRRQSGVDDGSTINPDNTNGLPEEDMYFNRKKKQGAQGRGRAERRQGRLDRNVPDDDDRGSDGGPGAEAMAEGRVRRPASSSRIKSGGEGKGMLPHDGMTGRGTAAAAAAAAVAVAEAKAEAEAEASKNRSSYSRSIAAASKAASNPGYADSACGSVLVLDRASGKGFSVPNPYDHENELYRSGGNGGGGGGSSGKPTNKMSLFGSAVRSAVSGRGDGGRSRRDRSDSPDRSPRATPNGDLPEKQKRRRRRGRQQDQERSHRPSSPAGYVHTAEVEARRRQERGRQGARGRGSSEATGASSPASSRKSAGSSKFFSNFLSNSKKAARAEAAAKDTFGSSDGSDTPEGGSGSIGSFGGTRPTHQRKGSRGSSIGLSPLSRDKYTVAPVDEPSDATLAALVRSSSVSQLIAKNEKRIGDKVKRGHTRGTSTGSARWPFTGSR